MKGLNGKLLSSPVYQDVRLFKWKEYLKCTWSNTTQWSIDQEPLFCISILHCIPIMFWFDFLLSWCVCFILGWNKWHIITLVKLSSFLFLSKLWQQRLFWLKMFENSEEHRGTEGKETGESGTEIHQGLGKQRQRMVKLKSLGVEKAPRLTFRVEYIH